MHQMINLFLSGDVKGPLGIHRTLDPPFKGFGSNGRVNPIPLWQAAINLCGVRVGPPRLPLDPATPQEVEIMHAQLERLGLP